MTTKQTFKRWRNLYARMLFIVCDVVEVLATIVWIITFGWVWKQEPYFNDFFGSFLSYAYNQAVEADR